MLREVASAFAVFQEYLMKNIGKPINAETAAQFAVLLFAVADAIKNKE